MCLISVVLSLLLVINPLVFEAVAWAEEAAPAAASDNTLDNIDTNTANAVDQTEKANTTLQNQKKIKKGLFGGSKIDKANAQISKAKVETSAANEKAKEGKTKADAATADAKRTIGEQIGAGAGTALADVTKKSSGIQKGLIKTGQILQKIGKTLKTVGQALQLIGKVLTAIPWTTAIGQALSKVGKILYQVGSALDSVGKVIENIGQTAANSDASFGSMLKKVSAAAKEGWKQGGKDADAYEQKLNDQDAKTGDTSANMTEESASEDTSADTGADSETVDDVPQNDVTDM